MLLHRSLGGGFSIPSDLAAIHQSLLQFPLLTFSLIVALHGHPLEYGYHGNLMPSSRNRARIVVDDFSIEWRSDVHDSAHRRGFEGVFPNLATHPKNIDP